MTGFRSLEIDCKFNNEILRYRKEQKKKEKYYGRA